MSDTSGSPLTSANLGFPRIGPGRELKWALERYWSGAIDAEELDRRARAIRLERWRVQREAGIDLVPSGDFSLYDHVLDTALMVGAVPERFRGIGQGGDLDLMFAMARGARTSRGEVAPLDMTKWFDTNYHYLVPELEAGQPFELASDRVVAEFQEAVAQGLRTRPVLLGPITFLCLSKVAGGRSALSLLDDLLPVYQEVIRRLHGAGAEWVQLDEPCLAQDAPVTLLEGLERAYAALRRAEPELKILLATYFGGLGANLETTLMLPVDAVHLDLVRGRDDLDAALRLAPESLSLSLGVVDGRNVWRMDPDPALQVIREASSKMGSRRITVAPSCPLLHLPVRLASEGDGLDRELASWMAFAEEKLSEVVLLARAVGAADGGEEALHEYRNSVLSRRRSPRRNQQAVRDRAAAVGARDLDRGGSPERRREFRQRLGLPVLPTTTIGSFPQRSELRQARTRLRRGEIDQETYDRLMEEEIRRVVSYQEAAGLDVLVHGEPERNDMVEYFAERLEGMLTTTQGWVQSYGSRCAKPPIVFGDVHRTEAMTVRWTRFAQSLTSKPVKGVITGPVTILQWSFPREDIPRSESCRQIALALRDEVLDLASAGVQVVQIDEPALREGLPLRKADQAGYLRWAVDSFRLAAAGAGPAAQIHTHMCYSEFGDIMDAIIELDADALFIEAARSGMALLRSLAESGYPSEVGPGLYDIHSPVIPTIEEMAERLRQAAGVLPLDRLWANPDCGLKTRRWEEVEPALRNLVQAARAVADELTVAAAGRP